MIQSTGLYKSFGEQVLFENISFQINKGERIGLVGRNGSGKSTLFTIIQKKVSPDQGSITYPKNYTIGALDQHIHFTKPTVLEECTQVLKSEESFDDYKAKKILTGLGFTDEDLLKNPMTFSGGYQLRINLCKSLLVEPNLLLLDEPTNYLDIISMRWLRRFLNSFDGEVIIITHDRDFMDSVITHTMGIHRKSLKKIPGKTAKYYEQLIEEETIYEKTRQSQEKKKAHLENYIERFGAKATKAAQAQSRQKQLEKLEVFSKLEDESSMELSFQYKDCPGKEILKVSNISFAYSGGPKLFENIHFSVGKNDRIGIIGKNGKGKSTLLNIIAKEIESLTGNIIGHPSIEIGHLGQSNVQRLTPNSTVVEEIQSSNQNLSMTAIRNICGSIMFEGDMAKKLIKVLSGGEKNRVLLGKILAKPTNLLLLDEPTNHLDMESIEILIEEIQHYPGALIIVSHSENVLRRVVNKLLIFNRGKVDFFEGSYDDFLEKVGWEEEDSQNTTNSTSKLKKENNYQLKSEITSVYNKKINPLKKMSTKIEEEIMVLEQELENIHKLLETASQNSDKAQILDCSSKIGTINIKISVLFDQLETNESDIKKLETHFQEELQKLN